MTHTLLGALLIIAFTYALFITFLTYPLLAPFPVIGLVGAVYLIMRDI